MRSLSATGRLLIAAGVVAAIAGVGLEAIGGTTNAIIGAALLGLTGIAAVALAFLLVGESEDRDRDRNPRG